MLLKYVGATNSQTINGQSINTSITFLAISSTIKHCRIFYTYHPNDQCPFQPLTSPCHYYSAEIRLKLLKYAYTNI